MLNSTEHEIYPVHINVKMLTIFGILTFKKINTTSESFRAKTWSTMHKNVFFLPELAKGKTFGSMSNQPN